MSAGITTLSRRPKNSCQYAAAVSLIKYSFVISSPLVSANADIRDSDVARRRRYIFLACRRRADRAVARAFLMTARLPRARTRRVLRSSSEALPPNHVYRRPFSVAGPLVWNSLPDCLRDPAVSRDTFCNHLKTFLYAMY